MVSSHGRHEGIGSALELTGNANGESIIIYHYSEALYHFCFDLADQIFVSKACPGSATNGDVNPVIVPA